MSGTGGAPVQPGESQTGKVVKENEQSEPVETTGKGLLDKAKDAVGLGQSKQDEELTAQGGAASAGNAGASGDTAADGGSRI